MRVKNATFVQKHIEKLILLAAVLFLLVVLAIFVGGLFNPYAVELGGQEYAQPAAVYPALLEKSNRLQTDLQKNGLIPEEYEAPDMATNYKGMLDHPVTTMAALPQRLAQTGTPISAIRVVPPPPPYYVVPNPPMPTDVAMESGFDVLDLEFDPRLNGQFADLWGGARIPPDFNYVVIEGEFSMWDWVQALQGESGQSGKIPSGIWKDRLGITGVYLIREELDPTTGRWGNRTTVRPLPDQIQVMPSEPHASDTLLAQQLIEEVKQLQQFIAMPALPAVLGGGVLPLPKDNLELNPEFGFPNDGFPDDGFAPGLNGEPMNERERLQLERRQRLEERRRERDAERRRRDGGDEFDDGPGGGNDAAEERRRELQRQRELEERRRRMEAEEAARQAAAERARRERERENLGGPGGFDDGGLGIPGIQGLNIQPDQPLRVSAADLTAEYGKTYRYKLAVAVINPLYGVPRLEKNQLAENATKASHGPDDQAIDAVEWIGPVVVSPKYEFFFVGGGENRSRIEIWTIFNGQRIKQEFEVSAGDPIGGIVTRDLPQLGQRDVDLRVGATVVDIERRRDINGQSVYALIYIDNEGKLFERLQSDDQANPRRRELERNLRDQQRQREEDLRFRDNGFGEFDDF